MDILEKKTFSALAEEKGGGSKTEISDWALLGSLANWSKGFECAGHKLLPAVIQSKRTGEVLMLGYMSLESFEASLKMGRVVFFSRTRQRLWCKGETSGHYFEILGVALDCDQDTFLFSVLENGPACHREVTSCFSKDDGSDLKETLPQATVISRVYDTILLRAQGADPASYSYQLLTGKLDRILKKIGEEAAETIVAAKNLEQIAGVQGGSLTADFAGEAADLVFHLLLCCAKLGISPEQIMDVLADRQGAPRRDGTLPKG